MSEALLPVVLEVSLTRSNGTRLTIVQALPSSVETLEEQRLLVTLRGAALDTSCKLLGECAWQPGGYRP